MALSDDLRSLQVVFGELAGGNPRLVALLCDNLQAIADQVEALETVPLACKDMDVPVTMLPSGAASAASPCPPR